MADDPALVKNSCAAPANDTTQVKVPALARNPAPTLSHDNSVSDTADDPALVKDSCAAPANDTAQVKVPALARNPAPTLSHDNSHQKRKKRKHGRKPIGKPKRRTKQELEKAKTSTATTPDVPSQEPLQVVEDVEVETDAPALADDLPFTDDTRPDEDPPQKFDTAPNLSHQNSHMQRKRRKNRRKHIGKPKRRTKQQLERAKTNTATAPDVPSQEPLQVVEDVEVETDAPALADDLPFTDDTTPDEDLPQKFDPAPNLSHQNSLIQKKDDLAPTDVPTLRVVEVETDAPALTDDLADDLPFTDDTTPDEDPPQKFDTAPNLSHQNSHMQRKDDLAPTDEPNNSDTDAHPSTTLAPDFSFQKLKDEAIKHEEELNKMNFDILKTTDRLQLIQVYEQPSVLFLKFSVSVDANFQVRIAVHGKSLPNTHEIFNTIPHVRTVEDVLRIARILTEHHVCLGNPEDRYKGLQTGKGATYVEDNCGAAYSSTIRSASCSLLSLGTRCGECAKKRSCLRTKEGRAIKTSERRDHLVRSPDAILSSSRPNSSMTREELNEKNRLMKSKMKRLELQNRRLREKISAEIKAKGKEYKKSEHEDIDKLVKQVTPQVEETFAADSFQRVFWEEQVRYNNLKNKGSMRWHPLIVKWALLLKSKSSKAYQTMRESGFVNLPSERTLYNYSHCTPSKLGFVPEAVSMLTEQCKEKGLYGAEWKKSVGLLQDEIKLKSDLVYCPTTGELIGYTNLDDTSNQIKSLEEGLGNTAPELATSALVLMVRGAASDLRFPLAAFATDRLDADQLDTILWQAIDLLENDVGLKVLFITCDGASQNRKFFEAHRHETHDPNEPVNSVTNPYDPDRQIYLISDAPHLLKTARNCFANSNSHKKSRHLWNSGHDISWLHLVKLYEEHIEHNLYTKSNLTRNHIDMTSFNQMKVSLAGQIFSAHVAEHLEQEYGPEVSGTVKFIRLMNRFFDCVNTRNLWEGQNKRNKDLDPYRESTDERLNWLSTTFLEYFTTWRLSVESRQGNFSREERMKMQLSHQTIDGLKITVRSIVGCVKFLLDEGAPFVLTEAFNQDILEQHFGHYRDFGGHNNNPTVNDVRHTITVLRTVGSTALAPLRGNTKRRKSKPESLETLSKPLPRKKSRPSSSSL